MSMSGSRSSIAVFVALVTFCETHSASAASSGVTAVLSNSEAAVGATVQLQIRVTGARSADAPENIAVTGLEIHRTGTSQHFEMNNFNVTSSVIYDYTIMPLQAGTFIIPPQTIRVGNNSLRTPELRLNVADSPGRSVRSNQNAQPANATKLVFAELIAPKKTAYVGEIVPVEIRLGFDPRAHPKLLEGPEISGQGFTAQKLQQSGENLETINGRSYDVVTFKTAIAAARAGKFEIGPIKAKAQVLTARRPNTPRSRSPFDLFNLDDPFSDPFFSDPFSQFGERREVEISGTKTFEMVLSPNEKKETIPLLAFSYFDPAKEQYVTLRSDPIAINVQGGAVPAPAPVASQSAASTMPAAAAAAAAKQDILYQLNERGRMQSFTPLYARPIFWIGQLIPLLALLGFAGWKIRQARIDNRDARRIAALQHEAAELLRKLRRNDVSPREYYAEASRVVRVKAALARNVDPNTVDAETAANTFRLNADSRERLRRLFEQSDEFQYSGAHNGSERISSENRRDVLELVEHLHV